jgi:hypothetical protein
MTREFIKMNAQIVSDAKNEYKALGLQLKELTRAKIAEKFLIHSLVVTAVALMSEDDYRLIGELIKERQKMIKRRKELREQYYL